MIAKWRTWQQWPRVTGKMKDYVMTERNCLNVKTKDCMMTMWQGVNVEMKDVAWCQRVTLWKMEGCLLTESDSYFMQTGDFCGVTVTRASFTDRWFLWRDCDTSIAYSPVILVVWQWHEFFTDWLFLGCDCVCDTCDSCVGVVICCNSDSEFYAGCFSLWHAHSTEKCDSCGVTTTHVSLRPVIRVVWLWHMRPADRCLCVVTLTHLSFRPVINVVWLWHIHDADQWHLWCDCDTRIMQTCGVCGMNMAHASCRGFMWCNCGTCIMQTGDSCRVILIHASCGRVILVVLLFVCVCVCVCGGGVTMIHASCRLLILVVLLWYMHNAVGDSCGVNILFYFIVAWLW